MFKYQYVLLFDWRQTIAVVSRVRDRQNLLLTIIVRCVTNRQIIFDTNHRAMFANFFC